MTANESRPAANGAAESLAGGRTSASVPNWTGCPCGCESVRGEQCQHAEPWSLSEPESVQRAICPVDGHYCGSLGIAERETVGRAGKCCQEFLRGAAA